MGVTRAAAFLLAAAAGSGGCGRAEPATARQPGGFPADSPVRESSGVAMSRAFPGRFWTLNDSGNEPALYLADTTGAITASIALPVPNTDWEALSAGPCGTAWCLYVADIGDNGATRKSVTIFRVREPEDEELQEGRATVVDSLVLRYADGPQDAETLIVDSAGNAAIVAKGQSGGVSAFTVPRTAWGGPPVTVEATWSVPIATSILLGRLITDGALSPSGRVLAIRTYRTIHLFALQPGDDWLPTRPAGTCDIRGLEPLGEGLAWFDDETLLLTSETLAGRAGPITLLECRPQ